MTGCHYIGDGLRMPKDQRGSFLRAKWCLCTEPTRLTTADFDDCILYAINTPPMYVWVLPSKPTRRDIGNSLQTLPAGFFDAPTALTFL